MANLIIADENEGRRNLLAGTLEREGFSVTRTSTLRQTEGTALGTMPDVLVLDAEWRSADALDSAQRLMADPEFSFKSRIVLLSRDTSRDMLVSAAKAGIHEVLGKPLNMSALIVQLWKHAKKEFVPPPAEVGSHSSQGFFDVNLSLKDPTWAMPMLQNMLNPEVINPQFVEEILAKLAADEIEIDGVDSSNLGSLLRTVFGQLLESHVDEDNKDQIKEFQENIGDKKTPKLGTSLEDVLQEEADELTEEILTKMEEILSEGIPEITALEDDLKIKVDPEFINLVKHSSESIQELFWEIGVPGRLNDPSLSLWVEDSLKSVEDILKSMPEIPDEEE
ncbi:MAG: response regulator [Candidatus Thermoplasmatota archaeon]|nr:response regulator [Candidatus Thermoplasmatota archaeon]